MKRGDTFEASAWVVYGCSREHAIALNDGLPLATANSKALIYRVQRANAGRRGVAWEITFPEWLSVWLSSGHFERRGRNYGGYCMARHGDEGAYRVGNVSIQPVHVNGHGAGLRAIAAHEQAGTPFGKTKCGTGRGWSLSKRGKPYRAKFRNKYLGSFATQQEAEAVYQAAAAAYLAA